MRKVTGTIIIPSCPNLETIFTSFDLVVDWVDGEYELEDPPYLQFVQDHVGMGDKYFPALKQIDILGVKCFRRLRELGMNRNDLVGNEIWYNFVQDVFPEESVDVLWGLGTLRIPEEWAIAEQDFRARLPPHLHIIYEA